MPNAARTRTPKNAGLYEAAEKAFLHATEPLTTQMLEDVPEVKKQLAREGQINEVIARFRKLKLIKQVDNKGEGRARFAYSWAKKKRAAQAESGASERAVKKFASAKSAAAKGAAKKAPITKKSEAASVDGAAPEKKPSGQGKLLDALRLSPGITLTELKERSEEFGLTPIQVQQYIYVMKHAGKVVYGDATTPDAQGKGLYVGTGEKKERAAKKTSGAKSAPIKLAEAPTDNVAPQAAPTSFATQAAPAAHPAPASFAAQPAPTAQPAPATTTAAPHWPVAPQEYAAPVPSMPASLTSIMEPLSRMNAGRPDVNGIISDFASRIAAYVAEQVTGAVSQEIARLTQSIPVLNQTDIPFRMPMQPAVRKKVLIIGLPAQEASTVQGEFGRLADLAFVEPEGSPAVVEGLVPQADSVVLMQDFVGNALKTRVKNHPHVVKVAGSVGELRRQLAAVCQ